MFAAADDYLSAKNVLITSIDKVILDHLLCLHKHVTFLRPVIQQKKVGFENHYLVELSGVTHLSLKSQKKFTELSSDKT